MNFNVIDHNAEDILYAEIIAMEMTPAGKDTQASGVRFLHCQFFQIATAVEFSDIRDQLEYLLEADECTLYFFQDGDLMIKWLGGPFDIREQLICALALSYGEKIEKFMPIEEFFIDYDMIDSRGKLKKECAKKLKKQTKAAQELAKHFSNEQLITTLKKTIQLTAMQRAFRTRPHILVVDDQIFSQKILETILKEYTVHTAKNAGEALLMYMERSPDIVFLDIGLPDLSGHTLARLLNRIDPDSHVVMVTGNQYESDIRTAQKNNVKGFVIKPFEKNTILKVIEQFHKTKKKRRSLSTINN